MKRLSIFLLSLALSGCGLFGIPRLGGSPEVASVTPGEGATNVSIGAQVNADLDLPNGGLSLTSVAEQSVRLSNVATGVVVDSVVSVDNDAGTLTLDPVTNLDFSTEYRFTVTSAVEDESGEAFEEFSSTFTTISDDVPAVITSRPADGERDVSVSTGIATDLNLPNSGVDADTISSDSVYLANLDTGERVAGTPGTTGGRDSITFQPSRALDEFTEYQFNITSAVTDEDGVPFLPYTANFTTGAGEGSGQTSVELVEQSAAARERHSSLAFGPDGNLYATTIDGRIKRYPVSPDGTLGSPTTITSLQAAEGGPRLTIGLAFDPTATPDNLIAWVTHTELGDFDGSVENGVDAPWAGKLTRMSGTNLENVQDVVVGLPRSSKDHVTNSVAFNPAEPGVVYFVQGSNTAMGAPDPAWRYQPERVLTGAVLRLDTNLLGSLPFDAQTEDGGSYDPYAAGAPLTVYGSGTRNSYDLVWHSNGNLYVPANGSAAGGIIPRYDPLPGTCENRPDGGYSGPVLDNPTDVNSEYRSERTDGWVIRETQNDYLFKIEEGGYYGTPNPKRCEWILFGGGTASDSSDVPEYPASVASDPNYRGFVFDYGKNYSPNGSLEYEGDAFGELRGKLLTVRYSQGDDIIAVTLDNSGNATGAETVVPSGSFADPIDVAEDPRTGFLYVSSYDELSGESATRAGVTLLRPR